MGSTARPSVVVVPLAPGPVVPLDGRSPRRRERDDLDELIDDLFPEADDRPGWFDLGLVVAGLGVLGWAAVGDVPVVLVVLAGLAVLLGSILPIRSAWHGLSRRRLLSKGMVLDAASPGTARLLQAYEEVLAHPAADAAATAAAHGALLEVASLLQGEPPGGPQEVGYVEKRAQAVEALAAALGKAGERSRLVEAREELDRVAGFDSVARLEALTDEVRTRRDGSR